MESSGYVIDMCSESIHLVFTGRRTPHAYMVGVVSRGLKCANANSPGVYAQVKSFLAWIYEVGRSHQSCKLALT